MAFPILRHPRNGALYGCKACDALASDHKIEIVQNWMWFNVTKVCSAFVCLIFSKLCRPCDSSMLGFSLPYTIYRVSTQWIIHQYPEYSPTRFSVSVFTPSTEMLVDRRKCFRRTTLLGQLWIEPKLNVYKLSCAVLWKMVYCALNHPVYT